MRQRLSSKFIEFKPLSGEDIYQDFFYDGKLQNEEGIESVYNAAHSEISYSNIKVFKYKAPLKGRTDGYIKCKITESDGVAYVNFCGLQEVKLNIKRGSTAYRNQIAQALLYYCQYKVGEIKVIIINSVNYFDYFFIDENEGIIDKEYLLEAIQQGCPSTMCKKITIPNNLKIYRLDMPTKEDISKSWKHIYKHCLDL